MAVRLSALRAGHPLPPGRFLVLIVVRGRVNPTAIVRLEGLGKLNKSSELIRNRTRDLPVCSIVPQPTMLLHIPVTRNHYINYRDCPVEIMSRDSSVGIATGYGLDDQGGQEFESR
jgi:hypothetical protein